MITCVFLSTCTRECLLNSVFSFTVSKCITPDGIIHTYLELTMLLLAHFNQSRADDSDPTHTHTNTHHWPICWAKYFRYWILCCSRNVKLFLVSFFALFFVSLAVKWRWDTSEEKNTIRFFFSKINMLPNIEHILFPHSDSFSRLLLLCNFHVPYRHVPYLLFVNWHSQWTYPVNPLQFSFDLFAKTKMVWLVKNGMLLITIKRPFTMNLIYLRK